VFEDSPHMSYIHYTYTSMYGTLEIAVLGRSSSVWDQVMMMPKALCQKTLSVTRVEGHQ